MNAVIPAAMARLLMASMLAKTLATAATPPSAKLSAARCRARPPASPKA